MLIFEELEVGYMVYEEELEEFEGLFLGIEVVEVYYYCKRGEELVCVIVECDVLQVVLKIMDEE